MKFPTEIEKATREKSPRGFKINRKVRLDADLHFTAKDRIAAEILLDPKKLVVFGYPVRTTH